MTYRLSHMGEGYPDRAFGLELECEYFNAGVPGYAAVSNKIARQGWGAHGDGSLRNNGSEWVSPPMLPEAVLTGLSLLYDMKELGAWRATQRCGIHIHVNVSHLNKKQAENLLTNYVVCEPYLFSLCGPTRAESNFCIPWWQSDSTMKTVRELLRNPERRTYTNKYAALNTAPLANLGTVEFRMAETFEKYAKAKRWVEAVQKFVTAATEHRFRIAATDPEVYFETMALPGSDYNHWYRMYRLLNLHQRADSLVRTRPDSLPSSVWGVPAGLRE